MDLSSRPKSKTRTVSGGSGENGGKNSKRRAQISIMDKVRIIQRFQAGESASNIAVSCGIGQSTVCEIIQAEAEIMETLRVRGPVYCETHYQVSWPHYGRLAYPLRQWLTSFPREQLPVNPHVIKKKAVEIAEELGLKGFIPSKSWMNRFHKKNWKYCGNVSRGESSRSRHSSKSRTNPAQSPVHHPPQFHPHVSPVPLPETLGMFPGGVHPNISPEDHLQHLPFFPYPEGHPRIPQQIHSPSVPPGIKAELTSASHGTGRKSPTAEQEQVTQEQYSAKFKPFVKSGKNSPKSFNNFNSLETGHVSNMTDQVNEQINPGNITRGSSSCLPQSDYQKFPADEVAGHKSSRLTSSPKIMRNNRKKKTRSLEQIAKEILYGTHFFLFLCNVVVFNFCCRFAKLTNISNFLCVHVKLCFFPLRARFPLSSAFQFLQPSFLMNLII